MIQTQEHLKKNIFHYGPHMNIKSNWILSDSIDPNLESHFIDFPKSLIHFMINFKGKSSHKSSSDTPSHDSNFRPDYFTGSPGFRNKNRNFYPI